MSIEYIVRCDLCYGVSSSAGKTKKDALKSAQTEGWDRDHDGIELYDRCDYCLAGLLCETGDTN